MRNVKNKSMETTIKSSVVFNQELTDLEITQNLLEVFENEELLETKEINELLDQYKKVYNYFQEVYGSHLIPFYRNTFQMDEVYLEDLEWMFKDGYDVQRILNDLRSLIE